VAHRTARFSWAICCVLFVSLFVPAQEGVKLSGLLAGAIEMAHGKLPVVSSLEVGLTARGDDWRTSLRATSENQEFFSYLGFSDQRPFGPISLQTLLVFNPQSASFSYFSNLARCEIHDIGIANYLYIPDQSDRVYDQITVNGAAGGVRWRSVTRLGFCPLEFRTTSFRADWTYAECKVDLGAVLSVGKEGFERFRLTATRREVPALTFGSLATDFVLTLDYELDEKTLTPQLRTRTARTSFCLTPMLELDLGTPLAIAGLVVYGIKLECSLGEDVSFYAATSLEASKNLELIGNADYFEVYRLTVRRPSCCDEDMLVSAAVYFEEKSAALFDWGMLAASFDLALGSKIRTSLAVEVPNSGAWSIRCAWEWSF
jgi:hypothetical protein